MYTKENYKPDFKLLLRDLYPPPLNKTTAIFN
jgi:hypothetical protein